MIVAVVVAAVVVVVVLSPLHCWKKTLPQSRARRVLRYGGRNQSAIDAAAGCPHNYRGHYSPVVHSPSH